MDGCAGGTVLAAYEGSRSLLVACDGAISYVNAKGERLGTGITTNTDFRRSRARTGRYVPLSFLEDQRLIDMETGNIGSRAYGGEEGIFEGRLLETHEGGRVTLRDSLRDAGTELTTMQGYIYGRQFGRWVSLRGEGEERLIDMKEGRIVGLLSQSPIMIRPDGALLLPAKEESRAWRKTR